ncbi:MAG TPA: hypothetical protein VK731_04380, partial [Candidatus Cybelea sp.]|nr:hypothetical protein [Candidatus Cybelea sp.]
SSEKAVDLNLGQINALMAWLQHGGHLVVGVEQLTDVNAKPWLRELIPCTLNSTVNVSAHQALLEWAHAAVVLPEENDQNRPQPRPRNNNGQVRLPANPNNNNPNRPRSQPASPLPSAALNSADLVADDAQFDATPMQVAIGTLRDGKVLIGEPAAPLAITAPRGRGKVTVLTFSPEREPFLSWKNRTWFWAKLADVPSTAFSNPNGVVPANRLSSDGIFRAMIETKQVRKLPLGWLLALLLAYLLVIGPLDQYWLKKINRQMLTWVTFPCYVVFFSALIYFIGFHLRAGELEWNELNVVDILPDNERAVLRGQTYVSIYSPNNEHYKLASNQKFASLRGQYQGNYGGNQEGGRATVDQTGNNFRADAFVAVWTSELFVSDWVEPSALPADMTVKSVGQGWEVTVNNELDHTLAGVQAVLAGRICALGDVPARQSKTFTVRSGQGSLVSDLARQYGDRFRNAVGNLRSSFGNNENLITDVPQAATATSFLSYINMTGQQSWNNFTGPANLDLSRFLDKDYAILLAWDAGHSPSALNQFAPKRFHSDTLFRLVVPIKM